MTAFETRTGGRGCHRWNLGLAALALACGVGAWAQVVSVPTAHLHHTEGSVAYAPHGDKEWHDVQPRRLLKRGDRLWTDRGSRAEVQASGHALRLDGETQLVLENVSETAAQLSLTQGSIVATVTHLNPGDSFEVGTPNLAFRARQPGDYRIDVDVKQGITRLVVLSGAGVVYGETGEALEVRNGQRLTFRERTLTRVRQAAFAATDDFDRWAGARRRGEPTVTMPTVTAAPAPAAAPAPTYSGRTIIISGTAASLKNAPAAKPPAVAPAAPAQVQAARPAAAQPAAGPMRVNIPSAPGLASMPPATLPAPAAPQPQAAAREQQDRQRLAQEEAREERQSAAARAERERRAAAEAKKAEERRRAVAARRADEERRQAQARRAADERREAQARRESEQKRSAARRAEERREAQARRSAAEKRLAAAREAEAQKVAEQARRHRLARLQEQAQREEQAVQLRREQARRADEERRQEARREEQARRDAEIRREEQARREEDFRRQRALADQWRREHERREQEVWLRQHQYQQPVRPAPMGVPARRIS